MKARVPLMTSLLLGGLTFSAATLAQDAVEASVVDMAAEAVDAETATLDAQADDVSEDISGDDTGETEEAPAWAGRVRITSESQPGPDGQPVSDRELRLVQRSTTGGELTRKAVLSLLSGTIGGNTFNKHQLHGTRIETVPNPAFNYLKGKMRESLGTYFAAHPGAVPENETWVVSTVAEFTLVYKDLGDAQTEYELRQTMHVGFPYRRKRLRLTGGEGAHCNVPEPVSAPLEAWQADDYAMARQVAQRYTDECAAKFAATLPTLFPDRNPVAVEPGQDS